MSEIGQNLAHCGIVEKIGKCGMDEVFRAKDRKPGRDVAIKVLPKEFARHTDRVARYQREAKLPASLNHPCIAAIHGLEECGGRQFLILESHGQGAFGWNKIGRGDVLRDRAETRFL